MQSTFASSSIEDPVPVTEPVPFPPRLRLAITPTPVVRLSRLGTKLGVDLYCKRDDLTGFGFGGNKIRKLEFLLHEAIEQGCDSIVTCGSNQSNWCRMTATAAVALGLEAHLVLGGGEPDALTGNLKLDQIVGAHMHFIDSGEDAVLEGAAAALADELIGNGQKAHRILMGGSTGLGTYGYLDAFSEILEFERGADAPFTHIFVATGSGGTQAGLVAGQHLHGWGGEVVGINVSRNRGDQEAKVRQVLSRFDAVAGTHTAEAPVHCDDAYVGAGYRKITAACEEAIELFARHEGIFLDEVYTGKAASGLIDYCRSGRVGKDDRVLFIHTGGAVQLFE